MKPRIDWNREKRPCSSDMKMQMLGKMHASLLQSKSKIHFLISCFLGGVSFKRLFVARVFFFLVFFVFVQTKSELLREQLPTNFGQSWRRRMIILQHAETRILRYTYHSQSYIRSSSPPFNIFTYHLNIPHQQDHKKTSPDLGRGNNKKQQHQANMLLKSFHSCMDFCTPVHHFRFHSKHCTQG